MDYNTDTWKVINNYFNVHHNYLTKHHLDSFNDFILNKIPQTLTQYNPKILYKELNKSTNKFKYETHIYYGGKDGSNIFIGRPIVYKDIDGVETKKALYPNESRLRNITYSSHIFCDIHIEYIIRDDSGENENKIVKEFKKVNLGQIPIMLHSKVCLLSSAPFETRKNMGECPYDQGGYFVVDGQEKVIVSHERKAENKLYIVNALEGIYSYSAQIKSVPTNTFKYARTTVVNINKTSNVMTVRLPSIKKQIPLFILFRALGVESDKEILEYILYDLDDEKSKLFMENLRPSIEDVGPIYNQDLALKYLANLTLGNSMSHLKDILNTDVFPHVGDSNISKMYYLGHVVHKLLNVLNKIDVVTDRDSFVYKRVDLSGFLLANLFRESFKQFQRDTKIAIDSEYRFNSSQYQDLNYQNIINSDNVNKIFNQNVITTTFSKAFKIGTILNKKGLIQSLNRLSNVGTISHLRRINTYGDMIMIGQRKLHPTQYGIICPVETPDGGNIGIKKHLTITGHITFGCDAEPIIKLLLQLGVRKLENIRPKYVTNNCKIFINGKWVGIHNDPVKLVHILKLFRQNSYINIFTSIVLNHRSLELAILTDGGRCCRPLYIMENSKLLINKTHVGRIDNTIDWYNLVGGFHTKKTDYYDCVYNCPDKIDFSNADSLIDSLKKTRSVIEFVDTDEMTQNLLCNDYSKIDSGDLYSHCEIHPSLIMGILGFTIPYVNTSQAPRNVYGTGQTKQSVGVYTSNFRNRFETSSHLLHYPQKPLITTRLSKYAFIDKLPTGINAIVAIASYSGYNQDDSIIINKSSFERGLFASSYFKTYDEKEEIDTRSSSQDFFYNPNDEQTNSEVSKRAEYNYINVNENGLAREGDYVNDNDVLISKYTKVGSGSWATQTDSSSCVKMDGYGVVDKVFSDYYNSDKQKMARVRICTYRNPALGDKFASRHGQKGVIGMILPQEEMPFTKEGIVPDIIINPHAIPSRMTLGQLVECVMGKACSIIGAYADATPFTNIDNNEIFNVLEDKCGFNRHGDEILYSGINGKQLSSKIFIGPTYYQRLKHMVKDKINSRATGPLSLKTRQPPSGRSVGGGLRIGEMERDAILSHGALQFLKETMIERSDKYSTYISSYSGMTSIIDTSNNKHVCPSVSGPLEFNEELELQTDNSSCDIVKVNIPYNTNLMIQECNAMGISLRLILDKESNYEQIDVPSKSNKFELQDSDKRKFILGRKETKTTNIIPKSKKNKEKFLNNLTNNKIIIQNLTKSVLKKDIQLLFNSIGPIFEIRMNKSNSAIVIYTNDDDATEAIKQLNNALLDDERIIVSLYTNDISRPYLEPLDLNVQTAPPTYGSKGWISQNPYNYGDEEYIPHTPTEISEGPHTPTYESYLPFSPKSPDYSPPSPDYSPPSPDYSPPSPDYSPPSQDYSPPKSPEFDLTAIDNTEPIKPKIPSQQSLDKYADIFNDFNNELEKPGENYNFGPAYEQTDYSGTDYNFPVDLNSDGDLDYSPPKKTLEGGSINDNSETSDNIKNISIDLTKNTQSGGGSLDFSELNFTDDNTLDLTKNTQSGGGSLDFSELNFDNDNFLEAPVIEGGGNNTLDLSNINNTLNEIDLSSDLTGTENLIDNLEINLND
jgi:DNA-directed RNA polymerase II subunit RPB2